MSPRLRTALIPAALVLWAAGLAAAAADVWPKTDHRVIGFGTYSSLDVHMKQAEVGGCTYIVASRLQGQSGVAMVHHAACQNPAHGRSVQPSTSTTSTSTSTP